MKTSIPDTLIERFKIEKIGVNSPKWKTAEKYFCMLNKGEKEKSLSKIEESRKKRDQIIEPYKDDAVFYTYLKMKEAAAGLGHVL